MTRNDPAVVAAHFQAVDHHQRAHFHVQQAAPKPEHLGQVRVLEKELPVQLVVLFVEGSTGDEQTDGLSL
jgi:hypothetical protein